MDAPPVTLLDVDGVLNAPRPGWGGPGHARHVTVDGVSLRLRWEPTAVACIRTLHMAGVVEVRWCTTWCWHADILERLWKLPRLERAIHGVPRDTWAAKAGAALSVLESGRRLVWVDDDLDPADLPGKVVTAQREGRALLVRPDPRRGLRPEHLHRIEEYARAGSGTPLTLPR